MITGLPVDVVTEEHVVYPKIPVVYHVELVVSGFRSVGSLLVAHVRQFRYLFRVTVCTPSKNLYLSVDEQVSQAELIVLMMTLTYAEVLSRWRLPSRESSFHR